MASPQVGCIHFTVTAKQTRRVNMFQQTLEFPLSHGRYTLSLEVSAMPDGSKWCGRIRTADASGNPASVYYTDPLHAGTNTLTVDIPEGEFIDAVSICFDDFNDVGNELSVAWIKLEESAAATEFRHPYPPQEFAVCQRYYQVRTANDIDPLDIRPVMATITGVKQMTGGYAYIAEL